MIPEKTITICGMEVKMRYCAAAETGYEKLSGKSALIFIPKIEKDDDGNVTHYEQQATTDDFIMLGMGAIIAAYAKEDQESPITASDIIYDAPPQEVMNLITTVVALRAKWYEVPEAAKEKETDAHSDEKEEKEKN